MYQKWKGLAIQSQNVQKIYPIQMKTVSLKYRSREEKTDAALYDVSETKGISRDERKWPKNLYYWDHKS